MPPEGGGNLPKELFPYLISRFSRILVSVVSNHIHFSCQCPEFRFQFEPLFPGGETLPSPGIFGPNGSDVTKFGLNTSWCCGNGVSWSEVQIIGWFVLGGGGGNWSLSYPGPNRCLWTGCIDHHGIWSQCFLWYVNQVQIPEAHIFFPLFDFGGGGTTHWYDNLFKLSFNNRKAGAHI